MALFSSRALRHTDVDPQTIRDPIDALSVLVSEVPFMAMTVMTVAMMLWIQFSLIRGRPNFLSERGGVLIKLSVAAVGRGPTQAYYGKKFLSVVELISRVQLEQ
jgi:hypothetical protein